MNKAFRTKYGLKGLKESNLTKFKSPQTNLQLKLVYAPDTWIMDTIEFKGQIKMLYLFFVEANTRYLIAEPGNIIERAESLEQTRTKLSWREVQNRLVWVLEKLRPRGIKTLITDKDPAYVNRDSKRFFQWANIKHVPMTPDQTSHIHTSILDRCVRTIRDMIFNLGLEGKELPPPLMQKIVKTYNETRHETLSQVLGFPATPKMVHEREELELLLIRNMRAINYSRRQQKYYRIPLGTEVFIRTIIKDRFQKKRTQVEPTRYTVIDRKGALYTLENNEGKIVENVPRRNIKFSSKYRHRRNPLLMSSYSTSRMASPFETMKGPNQVRFEPLARQEPGEVQPF